MSDLAKSEPGAIGWTDLTVSAAGRLRDFYQEVAGWIPEPLDMGGYSDFVMKSPTTGAPVAGICHQRGVNARLPPVWLVYITVADLDAALATCRELGGQVLVKPAAMGPNARYAVIQDPAGAICALCSAPS